MKVIKKKHGYKIEHKGVERFCTEGKIENVKKELLLLNGVSPKEIKIYLW